MSVFNTLCQMLIICIWTNKSIVLSEFDLHIMWWKIGICPKQIMSRKRDIWMNYKRFNNDYFLTVMWAEIASGNLCLCGLEILFLDCYLLQYSTLTDLKCPAICVFQMCVVHIKLICSVFFWNADPHFHHISHCQKAIVKVASI